MPLTDCEAARATQCTQQCTDTSSGITSFNRVATPL